MKKLIIIFLLLVSVANAQEQTTVANTQEIKNEIYDKRVSVFLHPVTLLLSTLALASDDSTCHFYATVEVPLNLSYSLIIRPSYLNAENFVKRGFALFPDHYYGKRIGSDFGFRCYYKNKKGDDSYWQGQIGLFYYNETKYKEGGFNFMGWSPSSYNIDITYMWFDVMGYTGKSWQLGDRFRVVFDAGFGYANIGGNSYATIDINFVVGIKIGKNKK